MVFKPDMSHTKKNSFITVVFSMSTINQPADEIAVNHPTPQLLKAE